MNSLKFVLAKRLFTLIPLILSLLVFVPQIFAETTEESAGEVNTFIPLMFALGIVLLASRLGGAIARVLGQPRVLGQLLVGVILGPTVLDMLHWGVLQGAELQHTIKELAELGVLLLMFNIGLEVHIQELTKVGKVALFGGVLGVVTPIILTMAVLLPLNFNWQQSLFAGVTLAATSVSISAQVLLELGHLRTKEGSALLATALIDDVLAILAVSLTLVITASSGGESSDFSSLILIIVQMAGYIVIAFLLAWFVLPRLMTRIARRDELSQTYGVPIFALIAALLFGWAAEYFGNVAAITGAFIAGVGLSQMSNRQAKHEIEQSVSSLAYVFLVPIFFVDVGLETNLSTFPLDQLPFMFLILAVAVISKVAGAGLGAKLGGFNTMESLRLGVCMISRGEVGLIIISIGLTSGLISASSALYASLFMVILLTTVLTPPLVRWVFQLGQNNDKTAIETKASNA